MLQNLNVSAKHLREEKIGINLHNLGSEKGFFLFQLFCDIIDITCKFQVYK